MSGLRAVIAAEIAAQGPIPFSRYMELCLYHPDLGYYCGAREKFGKGGDFYTASDVHALYGRLLARQFEEMWRALDRPARLRLIEVGPGRGLFLRDVLDWSAKKFPAFLEALSVTLVEGSPWLRQRLEENLRHHSARVEVTSALAESSAGAPAILFSNELFDALPVEVLDHRGQVFVDDAGERLVEVFRPPSPEVKQYVETYSVLPQEGERVEAGLVAIGMMREMAAAVPQGFVMAVDYGYTRGEQVAGRHLDTITTYRSHTAGHDALQAPGEQDMTAHVNFTALRAAAEAAGMGALGLVTQSQLLLGIGEETQFADAFEEARLPQEQAKIALQLKHLVTPAGMGEIFHALLLARGVGKEKAARLSGLTFNSR